MRLFPAIDLYEKQAVRLYKGDYTRKTVYSDDPVAVACTFREQGARYLHLVDLEGARTGSTPNFSVAEAILRESGLQVEIGGGVRNPKVAEAYLRAGAMRVILGTAAIEDPGFLKAMVYAWDKKIAVGVDVKNGYVATHGWTEISERTAAEFCSQLQEIGVSAIICTDISKDGAMKGPNVELYRALHREFPGLEVVASGGISGLEDVCALRDAGISGAILGKAVYEGCLDLSQAIRQCPQEAGVCV